MIHPSEPVLSAAAAAVLLTFAAASAAAMTPGVYSAAVPARNGELAVEVQVSADRIESVKVVRQQETPGIGSLAVEALPAAIVAQQTSSVDVVSGATMTSNAIIKAVSEALKQAGADASFFKKKTDAKSSDKALPLETQADVIIVGGGGAGMVAAATAVERGAKVIVLEKMAMLGNMSAMDPNPEKLLDMTQAVRDIVTKYTSMKPCSKAVADLQETVKKQLAAHDAAGKKYIFDSPELFALQTIEGGDCHSDPKLVLTMTQNATAAMNWLESQSDMTWFHVPRHWIDVGSGRVRLTAKHRSLLTMPTSLRSRKK